MFKQALAIIALLALTGCASENTQPAQPRASAVAQAPPEPQVPSEAELAAYAGAHPFPASAPARTDIRAAAIVNADQHYIKIYNFGTDPIRDADVWVNRAFVRHVNAIAPGTSVTIQMANLYNGIGQQFSARGEHVQLVQIQRDQVVETLMGPASQ